MDTPPADTGQSPPLAWQTGPTVLVALIAMLALIVTTIFVLPPGPAQALTPGYEITTTFAPASGDASTTYTTINATVEQPSLGGMTGPASAFSTSGIVGSNNSITSLWSANGTATFTFNPPVDNPILHIDRLGGFVTSASFSPTTESNTSVWTLNGPAGATLNRLSGTPHFEVVGSQIFRTPNLATAENSSCATSSASGTGCGTVQVTGAAISTLTFAITFDGVFLDNRPLDGVSVRIEVPVPEPRLTLVKTVTNDETVPGTAATTDFTLTADDSAGNAISGLSGTPAVTNAELPPGTYTLSEAGVAGYTQSITCSGGTLTGAELVLNTGDNATCTFVNNDADGDGDGVADSVDGEPANPCVPVPYAAGTQPAAGTDADCDGDGEPNATDDEPANPCVPVPYAAGTQPATGADADCDGDGAANGDDSDPGDPCATPGDPDWVELAGNDCDGDGTTVGDGDTADTNPCVPVPYAAGTQPAAGTDADCDGDGEPNATDDEPANPCVPVPYAAGTQPATGADADCDGDGEPNGTDDEPANPCVPVPYAAGTQPAAGTDDDCDGDGEPNATDDDPANPCVTNPFADAASQPANGTDDDCDGDGEPNATDDDPANPCVPVPYAAGTQPAAGTDADCDGDGAANGDDSDPGDPCATPGDPDWVELAGNDCDGDGTTVGDGDQDDGDVCVDASGTIDSCSDSDGDGVTDDVDAGPNDPCVPQGDAAWTQQATNDCDGDGTTVGDGDRDDGDVCVDASGTIDSCSDSDGDGVTDDVDADPNDPCVDPAQLAWFAPPANDCDDDGVTAQDGDLNDNDACVDAAGSACFRIDGRVWFDQDRGADQDPGEVDLSGIRLVLIDTASGQAIDEAFTASPYQFNDVARGTYRIELDASTLPAGVGITFEEDGSRNESLTVSIVNSDVLSQDFGYATTQVCGQLVSGSTTAPAGTALTVVDSAGNSFVTTTDAGGQYCVEGTLDNPLMAGTASVSASFGGSQVTDTVGLIAGTSAVRNLRVTPVAAATPAPTATPLPTPTATPLPTPTATPLPTPTATPLPIPTATPLPTPQPTPRAALAFTGSSSGTLLPVGCLLLASGAAFVALGARRRSATDRTD